MARAFTPLQLGELAGPITDPYSPWSRLLARKDGVQVSRYTQLLSDSVVFSSFDKVASEITQRDWQVVAHDKDNQKIADFVTHCLWQLGSNVDQERGGRQLLGGSNGFNSVLRSLIEAYIIGISFCEIKWKIDGKAIKPIEIKHRDPRRLQFIMLDDGYVEPRILLANGEYEGMPIPPRSMIIHRYWATGTTDVYGSGIGKQLIGYVQYREAVAKSWMAYADRFTMPTAMGQYPLGLPADEVINLNNGLRGLGKETAVTYPEGVVIDWLKAEGNPQIYQDILSYCDTQISNIISGESTVGQQGDGGSRARDSIADSVRIRKCKALADMLCDTISNTLIKWIVELNFGPKAPCPRLEIDFSDLETAVSKKELIALASDLGNIGYELDEEWLRRQLKMPIKKIQQEQVPEVEVPEV